MLFPQQRQITWPFGNFNATKLAITQVNGGNPVSSGSPFSVVVQAKDPDGSPGNVTTATNVSLSKFAGGGTLGGTTIGSISAGSSSTTISGVTYTNSAGEDGVVLQASATSGDSLTAGNSASFSVFGDPLLAFTQQPAASTAINTAFNPQPKVSIKDAFGHVITTDNSTQVTLALTPGTGRAARH